MDEKSLFRKLSFEIGIAKPAYQIRAREIVGSFLKLPKKSGVSFSLPDESNSSKVSVRVKENPPSVQIVHSPEGGQKAGAFRVKEKLFLPEQEIQIVTVSENDLTRETIIMNLKDSTLGQILTAGLISPAQVMALIQFLSCDKPNLFIVINRFLLGIELMTKTSSPFNLVEMDDKPTWEYLKNLTLQI